MHVLAYDMWLRILMCLLLLCVPLYISSEEEDEALLCQQLKMVVDGGKEKHQEGEVAIVSKDLFVLELLL